MKEDVGAEAVNLREFSEWAEVSGRTSESVFAAQMIGLKPPEDGSRKKRISLPLTNDTIFGTLLVSTGLWSLAARYRVWNMPATPFLRGIVMGISLTGLFNGYVGRRAIAHVHKVLEERRDDTKREK